MCRCDLNLLEEVISKKSRDCPDKCLKEWLFTFYSDKLKNMTNFAYLLVSTDHQDAKNQKLSVLDYCNTRELNGLKFVEDTVSGKTPWRERKIGEILEKAAKGDVIVASEVSRLGRSTLQVLEILEEAAQKGINKRAISKLIECAPSTLYQWLNRRHIHSK